MMAALTFYKKKHPSPGARDNRNTTPSPEADTRMKDRNHADRGTFPSKLIPFDPNKEHLETYFKRFANFAIHYKWNEDTRLFYMKNSLDKDIGTVL